MFALAEFGIESILREGLVDMKSDTDVRLDDIFGRLRLPDIMIKYGDGEISKIKEVLMRTPINIVQAQTDLTEMKMPAISIHLLADTESDKNSAINDYEGESSTPIDPAVIVPTFTPTSYTAATGVVAVDDTVDLGEVYENRWYRDGLGQMFQVQADISNTPGNKYFTIDTDIIGISLPNSTIVSAVDERIQQVDYSPADENIMIGIHCENSLLTKYLYYIVRYLLWRKRSRFQEYQMELSKYNGSDFAIAQIYLPERTHSRWITAQFITYNYWRGDEKTIIDAINPNKGGEGPYVDVVCDFVPTAYDSDTGLVSVLDSVDLSEVVAGHWFFDGVGTIFKINGGVDNTPGSKGFLIDALQIVDLTGGCIKQKYTIRAIAESDREDEQDMTWETDTE